MNNANGKEFKPHDAINKQRYVYNTQYKSISLQN